MLKSVISRTSPLAAFVAGTSEYIGETSACHLKKLSISGVLFHKFYLTRNLELNNYYLSRHILYSEGGALPDLNQELEIDGNNEQRMVDGRVSKRAISRDYVEYAEEVIVYDPTNNGKYNRFDYINVNWRCSN
jgi:hypothetical protein